MVFDPCQKYMAPAGYECLKLAHANQIILPLTIAHECGQAFRWRRVAVPAPTGHRLEWSLCLPDRVVFVQHDPQDECLYHRSEYRGKPRPISTAEWLHDYLNLGKPTDAWYREWCERDPIFARHAARFAGVCILRQDPWECMCSFICSSNNNIARISQMVHKLCDYFTEPLLTYTYPKSARRAAGTRGEIHTDEAPEPIAYHPFPSPTRLSMPDVEPRLRELGFGYRAKFIAGTARALCDRARQQLEQKSAAADDAEINAAVYAYLESLRTLDYYEAREALMEFLGIGPKVADCIALMSLDQHASIPVDRHVFSFADRWYGIRKKRYEEVADRLREIWGERAGWAHSVLFYADLRSFAGYGDGDAVKKEESPDAPDQKRARRYIA